MIITQNIESLFTEEILLEYWRETIDNRPTKTGWGDIDFRDGCDFSHSGTKEWYLSYIRCLFDAKRLFTPTGEKTIFLDLGCGDGNVVIYAAHHGWQAYGIDFDEQCYDLASKAISEATSISFIQEGTAKVAFCNFFPSNFEVSRFDDDTQDAFRECIDLHFISAPPLEVSATELELHLDQVDLFYHYQIERQDNLLRLFSEYAKLGAYLLIAQTMVDETFAIPKNVFLESEFGKALFGIRPFTLYQKIKI